MHLRFIKNLCITLAGLIAFCSIEAQAANNSASESIALRMTTPVVNGQISPDILAIQKRGTLRWAIYKYSTPPFSVEDSSGNWSGMEIDYAKMIAQQLGVTLTIVPSETYDGIVDLVASGQADIGSGVSITGKRGLQASFTDPYYTAHPHLLVNRIEAAKMGWSNAAAIVQGIKNSEIPIKIGVLANSSSPQLIQELFPNAQEVTYDDEQESMYDVVNGKIFAATTSYPMQIPDFLNKNPQAALKGEDVTIESAAILTAFVVPWQSYHFRNWLNVYFYYLKQNQIQAKIIQKYEPML